MTLFDRHEPGTFCWMELMTTDSAITKKFYGDLLGWTYKDDDLGDGRTYTTALLDGKIVAAMHMPDEHQKKLGIPPHWGTYVAVSSVDETAAKASKLGAKLFVDPTDAGPYGRLAVIQDPTGAFLAFWQPNSHQGLQVKDVPNSFCWTELMTSDIDAAGTFYIKLFDWKTQTADFGGTFYTTFMTGEIPAGGMIQTKKEWGDVPNNWMPYLAVDDCDKIVEQARNSGGDVVVPAMDIPRVGRMAVITDPLGAAVGVIKLEMPQG